MAPRDETTVCVVAASSAWPFYLAHGAYVCQANRPFRDAARLGFYSARTVHGLVPRIEHVVPNVEASAAVAARMTFSLDPVERRVGETLAAGVHDGMSGQVQVVLLSRADDPATVTIEALPHTGRTAWTMFQRYVDLDRLTSARSTDDLLDSAGETTGETADAH